MSIIRCVRCDRPIDTDLDADCFGEDGEGAPTCDTCRDNAEIATDRALVLIVALMAYSAELASIFGLTEES